MRRAALALLLGAAALAQTTGPPPLTITTSSPLPSWTVGQPYSVQFSVSGGVAPYTWFAEVLPPDLNLDSKSGNLSGTPSQSGTFSLDIFVQDSSQRIPLSGSKSFTVTFFLPPIIVTTSLPSGSVGVAYSGSLSGNGGTSPYFWSVTAGFLPGGLSLSSDGEIGGVPTTAGTFGFSVQLTDAAGAFVRRDFSIQIVPPPIFITTASLPPGTVGVGYSETLQATGGVPPYRWSLDLGTLPPGLNLNAAGLLSGRPTAPRTSRPFTVRVTDNLLGTVTRELDIVINPAPLAITTTSPLPPGTQGTAYSQTLVATGGTPPYSWSITAGVQAPGLALNSSTGDLTGTPTNPGTFNFTVTARDSASLSTSKGFSLIINPPALTITTVSCPNATVGTAYACALAATGGTPPYTWSISAGALPGGVAPNASTGSLTGTPTAAGAFNFTARVADSSGNTGTRQFSITVSPPPLVITTSSCPDGVVGNAYSCNLAATGGTAPYTWSITGALPGGLTIAAATGAIAGAPGTTGTSNFTAVVTDSAGVTASRALAIGVTAPTLTITTASCPNGVAASAYTCALAATGGVPPYRWSLAGAVAGGLILDAVTGRIAGTPTAVGTFNFTALVTDNVRVAASRALTIVIARPVVTPPSIRLSTQVVGPAQQPTAGIVSDAPAPGLLQGDLELRFVPDAVVPADDPNIQFFDPATMRGIGRRTTFRIPADATQALFGDAPQIPFQSGTVAGTITIAVTRLDLGGVDVTPTPPPTQTIQIRRAAPVITSVTIANRTTTSFQAVITGYALARAVAQTAIRLIASGTGNLQTTSLTLEVGPIFTTYYQGSAQFGSQFTEIVTLTITAGDISAIRAISVTLVNPDGTSNAMEANLP